MQKTSMYQFPVLCWSGYTLSLYSQWLLLFKKFLRSKLSFTMIFYEKHASDTMTKNKKHLGHSMIIKWVVVWHLISIYGNVVWTNCFVKPRYLRSATNSLIFFKKLTSEEIHFRQVPYCDKQ